MLAAESDNRHGVPFPGRELPRAQWTRTRLSLGRPGPFDWVAAFGRDGPRLVDLGCGNGRFLIASALARPETLHLGIELVPQAVRFASLRAGRRGLANVRFAWGDATEFLLVRSPAASLEEAHLYHPQPYYEADKVDRRLLTPRVLLGLHRALRAGGRFVFQTDNQAYADYARQVAPALFSWGAQPGPWPDAPQGRTLREIEARRRGLAVVRAVLVRLDLGEEEAVRRAGTLPEPRFDANRPRFRRRARGR